MPEKTRPSVNAHKAPKCEDEWQDHGCHEQRQGNIQKAFDASAINLPPISRGQTYKILLIKRAMFHRE